MKINELQAKQGNVVVEGIVSEKSEPREFSKFGNSGKVANAILKDDSGSIKLTLWNEQIDQVNIGDKVKIDQGYVSEWQGELQLSTGKFGTLTVSDSEDKAEPKTKADEKTKKEVDEISSEVKEDPLEIEEEEI